ncbi:hypothetical protein BT63DRAFT_424668 [Microthyrium microscopicum]|uniref:Secreted protein n=1 Tax=Microthyrium microscopicum TaxID=703497 RepID=A0A6A6UDF9_9PEZI|nr:hypothetical protein BT63DRAFT_424668 [Microthyrium microscopicum]
MVAMLTTISLSLPALHILCERGRSPVTQYIVSALCINHCSSFFNRAVYKPSRSQLVGHWHLYPLVGSTILL